MTETHDSSLNQEDTEASVFHDPDFARPLRQAREQAGLSVQQVASQLLLAVDIIEAIEKADMERLPSSTFVVGYIRSYAKILNVPADEVIEAYNALVPPPTESVSTQSPFAEAETVKSNKQPLLAYTIIAIVVAALLWWALNPPLKTEQSADTQQASEFSAQVESFASDATPQEFTAPAPTEDTAPVEDTVEPVDSADPEPVVQQESSQQDTLQGLDAPLFDELILTGVAESWAEVVDANGDRLFYQLINNGEEVKLSGQAPFDVFLGNAPVIRIEVNNSLVRFEHLISSSKNVASITIAADASVTRTKNR
ncbi:MAG TPA: RodZ domain-containing protein [Gammaproteobacteria bacterium]